MVLLLFPAADLPAGRVIYCFCMVTCLSCTKISKNMP
ncbi:hypothetical protein RO1_01530 [Roseburia intestinalis XB6B4]|uniref:Uncharacterized protein n=1 Tax=Roseburia intestinalis XB6B4 TaxID=718255 RepID=D4KUD9_9FIRM|nr:hypothetical protein RO1_01530 [Roseburia intestinalis XB6B4]